MDRRRFLAAAAGALAGVSHAEDGLVLALNEGVTYRGPGGGPTRLREIAEEFSRALKLPVRVLAMDQTADGKKRLESLNVAGFAAHDEGALLATGKWLGV